MKTLDELTIELKDFDKNFDPNNFESCVDRSMLLIASREAQVKEEKGLYKEFDLNLENCKNSVEEAICHRDENETMMSAAIKYIEGLERRLEEANKY